MREEHAYVQLARRTIERYVRHKQVVDPDQEAETAHELLTTRAGAFCSLHRQGRLRGCIGTIEATQSSLGLEIVHNAISAATRDPRFEPLRPEELADLEISVDVLGKPEPVSDRSQLDPRIYGVIVESGGRRGLLLPDLEGVDTVEQQIGVALQKAWISPDERYDLYRFRVTRYH